MLLSTDSVHGSEQERLRAKESEQETHSSKGEGVSTRGAMRKCRRVRPKEEVREAGKEVGAWRVAPEPGPGLTRCPGWAMRKEKSSGKGRDQGLFHPNQESCRASSPTSRTRHKAKRQGPLAQRAGKSPAKGQFFTIHFLFPAIPILKAQRRALHSYGNHRYHTIRISERIHEDVMCSYQDSGNPAQNQLNCWFFHLLMRTHSTPS